MLLAGVLLRTDELLSAIELATLLLDEELGAIELLERELDVSATLLCDELIAPGIEEDVADLPTFLDLDDIAPRSLKTQDVLVEVTGLV